MKRLPLILLTTASLAAAAPAAASADTLLTAAPGAANLATGGGYHAWFAPADGGWRLTLRAPDGTVTTPSIPAFPRPGEVSLGSQIDADFNRSFALTYARDGDLHAFDPRTGLERKLSRLSSPAYEESVPQNVFGSTAFVRRGGKRPGIYFASRGRSARRISTDTPTDLAFNGSRIAYPKGRAIVVQRVSGRGRTLVFRAASTPSSPALTRYRVAWLERATGTVRQTPRFAGSGGPYDVRTSEEAARALPGAQSIAIGRSEVDVFLDAEGVKRAVPPLF